MKPLLAICIILFAAGAAKAQTPPAAPYIPDDTALYRTIVQQDSIFFHAYNTCDMATQEAMYADSIEFYHDKGGLMTSKKEILESTRKYICGKVTRQLQPGSIEVYPIKGFGAVEMATHRFHNNQEPDAPSHPGKFIVIWKQNGTRWQLSRIVSLH